MEKVTCDSCNKFFPIKLRSKLIKDDVRLHYFRCPYCNVKYDAYYSNEAINGNGEEIRRLYEKLKTAPAQLGQIIKNKIDKLVKQNDIEIKRIRKEMEK